MVESGSQSTLRAPVRRVGGASPVPALTILYHSDLGRVGEVARLGELASGPVELSRDAPGFAPPGSTAARPLGDRHISRRPVTVARSAGGDVILSPGDPGLGLRVAGQPVGAPHAVAAALLEDGVVVELGDWLVLLLHLAPPSAGNRPPDLGLVGANPGVDEVRDGILRVADLPVPVLIRGETGTGKDLVAHAVHQHSRRRAGPFVGVNMAAIPASTAASELFGHARGAFTGAVTNHVGYFGRADHGTLFLDEIGSTPTEVQPMLLRALESHEIQSLGAAAAAPVDVRLIAATDADLEAAIADDSFRAALLHRLEGYQLFLPPLRQRRDDIGRLLVHFLAADLAMTGEPDKMLPVAGGAAPWLPARLIAELAGLAWPGNVRQLKNVVRQLVIASRGSPIAVIDPAVERLLGAARSPAPRSPAPPAANPATRPAGSGEPSEDHLIAALRAHDWLPNRAAAALGVSRSYVYRRIKESRRIRSPRDLDREEIVRCHDQCGGDLTESARLLQVSRRSLLLRMRELGLL